MDAARVDGALAETFGHAAFRPGQRELIDAILGGGSALGVLPTGAGKSLCYQLPAVLLPGLTVVVSPLIALMRDQVAALQKRSVAAAALTSQDDEADRARVWADLGEGRLRLLYVAPERFRSESFVDRLQRGGRIGLFTVDEAHCISTWGHDFRPDYGRLGEMVARLRPERVLALTATATAEVRADIKAQLGLVDALEVVTGFDRPNLALSVTEVASPKQRRTAVAAALHERLPKKKGARPEGSAIVYAATRKRTETVAELVGELGYRARAYHAGLGPDERERVEREFRDGKIDVVVATSAFGMGVDKPDVRVVLHWDLPSSPEAYYQEVGRAGRDGFAAAGVLLYAASSLRFAYARWESSCPTADVVERALAGARGLDGADVGLDEAADALKEEVGPAARSALVHLSQIGALVFDRGGLRVLEAAPAIDAEALLARARRERKKLDRMVEYALRARCRRRFLVDYFGDPHRPERCGVCDRCAHAEARELEGEAKTDALKALSCVARMKGRYGRGKVLDVLLGSKAKELTDRGLHQLSTYGLFADWTRADAQRLLDALERAGLVTASAEEYPTLHLSKEGAQVLTAGAKVVLDLELPRWSPTARRRGAARGASGRAIEAAEPARAEPPEQIHVELKEALSAWRGRIAKSMGQPAYVVLHNATIEALASLKPTSLAALERVPGFGPKRVERYGRDIVELVRRHGEGT